MASIKEERARGKRLSYKFRVCLGRDENGSQISKAMRWNSPEDMPPAKARKEAQRFLHIYYIKFLYCIKARTPNERKIKGGGGIYGYAWTSRTRKSTDFHRFRCISLDYCGKYVEIARHMLFFYVYVTISRIFQEIPGKSLTIYIKSIYNGMCNRRVARVLHIFCCAGMDSAYYYRYRQENRHRAAELCGKAGRNQSHYQGRRRSQAVPL